MNREKTMQCVEQDAERLIRMGAIRRAQQKARLWMAVFILSIVVPLGGLAVFLLLSFKSHSFFREIGTFWFFVFIIPLFFVGKPFRSAMGAYREAYQRSYIPLSLGFVFTELRLLAGNGISWEELALTKTMYTGDCYYSKNIICGKYRGIYLDQSDIRVERISHFRPELRSEGGRRKSIDNLLTVFRGQWTTASLNGKYAPELQIIERGFRNTKHRLSLLNRYKIGPRVLMKDLGFNLKFRVYASDRADADYLLTPNTRKQIRNMAAHTKGRLMLCFTGGELHIAVQTRRKAFSPPSVFLPFREERAIAHIQREIAPFTRLIDALNPDGKLFRHEEIQLPAKPAEKILWLD